MASYDSDNNALKVAEPPSNVDSSKDGGRVRAIHDSSDDSGAVGIGDYVYLGIVPAGFKLISLSTTAGTFDVVSLDSDKVTETSTPGTVIGSELPEGDILAIKATAAPAGAYSLLLQYTSANS